MKLYRFSGRAELFVGCGYLPIDHTVLANLTQLKKYATKWRADARKALLEHTVYIDTLYIETTSQSLLAKVLITENTELLVKNSVRLKQWEWNRDG